ncbi:MAG: hypothetical protein V4437_00440 [Patescibacteria group bacterium]
MPSETNPIETSPQKMADVSFIRRHFKLLVAGAVAVTLLVSVGLMWLYVPQLRNLFNFQNHATALNTKNTLKYFPNFGYVRVAPDPTDARYVWLFGQAGIMRVDTESQGIEDYTRDIPGIENRTISDVVRVGDTLFVGLQGGLVQYDLNTKTSKKYTTAEGLASNGNITITPDPSDKDTLWISTFEGLSKLTISSGHIENFKTEIGIPGSGVEPRVFHVDDRYVWLTANANAYTTGGIARLDKTTGIWKTWGYALFHYGQTPSRFDTYGAAADGERAIVEEDGIIYSYNAHTDGWVPITKDNPSDPVKREITLKGTTAYFWSGTLKELDIDTGTEDELLQPAMFINEGVSFENFSKDLLRIEFDELHNRLILYPEDVSLKSGIGIVPLENKKLSVVPFKDFEHFFGLFNVSLADANGNHILLNTENGLVDYDWSKNNVRQLLPYSVSVAKILGDKVVALNLATCELCSDIQSLVATSSVISLATAQVESSATIVGTTTDAYYIGDTINDIYLFTYNHTETNKGYKFDTALRKIIPIDLSFPHTWTPEDLYYSSGDFVSATSTSSAYSVSFYRNQIGDAITVSVQSSNGVKNIEIPVGPEEYHYWPTKSDTQITNYIFDPSNQNIFWIGTDRGLIRINLQSLAYRLFTTKDGLVSDSVSKVVPTSKIVAVQHPGGVYLYQF